MGQRSPISVGTISAVAAENAGHPLAPERAAALAEALEPVFQNLEALRRLPMKDAEPATVFRPVEVKPDD
ncbi:MAG: hypothetical protein ACMVY4_05265 [Minwuia sp.]|uniref:hypothetical protein n=1 Tax=Minwuia sp. TaxID=2493630 RepID=UPI003A88A694